MGETWWSLRLPRLTLPPFSNLTCLSFDLKCRLVKRKQNSKKLKPSKVRAGTDGRTDRQVQTIMSFTHNNGGTTFFVSTQRHTYIDSIYMHLLKTTVDLMIRCCCCCCFCSMSVKTKRVV
jgi:hypothetical protein